MAFNPSPKVADARALAKKHKKTHVVILMIDDVGGTMEYASYGTDTERCSEAKDIADAAYDAAERVIRGWAGVG